MIHSLSESRDNTNCTITCEENSVHPSSAGLPLILSNEVRATNEDTESIHTRIRWHHSVKDFKNQKTSKKCCVFHRQKQFDESSSEEDELVDEHAKCSKEGCYCNTRFT
ncbi:hypothetical protein XU18_0052 [Perkinsela sp. CCAP 1560/4]|nr:hypothetical protein XU18_0052 [Perkinsela sp. CCAP 1560/4]|eukprot:KNH09367.1 hypothetical protein XU18_0052 [Perkinsela sp. CCAP 1560/4]